MQSFAAVFRFELRQHLSTPLFWCIAALFAVLNLLTQTRTGINLGENERIALNSSWLIFQTQLVLGVFGMIPALIFPVTALTRDHERNTLELFFSTPVKAATFALARFSAATLAALGIGLCGICGALAGTLLPGLDPTRLLPFDWRPWLASFALLVAPNIVIFSAFFFAVAALTRSTALTFALALAVLVLEIFFVGSTRDGASDWLLLADPFGAIPLSEASRFWTVSELNSNMPTALLPANRVLWLGLALAMLLVTLWRFRLDLDGLPRLVQGRAKAVTPAAALPSVQTAGFRIRPAFGGRATLQMFCAQWRMDWRAVWSSPLYWIVLLLALTSIWSEAARVPSQLVQLPLYPVTAMLIDFFRYALLQFVLVALVWYSATLFWRERDCRIDGICDATPCPDWIPLLSKTLVLCCIVLSLFAGGMLVALAVQELADFHQHRIGVFLLGIFVYNGFSIYMLCVLAALVQVLSPGKWSGMLLVIGAFVLAMTLPLLGVEHLLLGFRIPQVLWSDMNGFGHFAAQTWSLIAYWGAFCALLLVLALLLYPRGHLPTWRGRVQTLRARTTLPERRAAALACLVLLLSGSYIFYNTNVLNEYRPSRQVFDAQARYEQEYGRWRTAALPSFVDPDLQVELYPDERRVEVRGTAQLRNDKAMAIAEFPLMVFQGNTVLELVVERASLVASDAALGFYLFRPERPLAPGESLTLNWSFTRHNRGFPNGAHDTEIVGNGSYVRSGMAPLPGYCRDCELASNRERSKRGLPPRTGLPALGDPQWLDALIPGLDTRSSFHAVIGTDADQSVVASGLLLDSREAGSRRYFEYAHPGPVWPAVAPLSGRYAVARDEWNAVPLEIHHHPEHAWNIPAMMASIKLGMDYYSRAFAPYSLPFFRMTEYARYSTRVQAGVGSIAYAEGSGFTTDLRNRIDLDYATLHELAHQWWGNDVYGAHMQGQQVLNEGLAQYSTFMALRAAGETAFLHDVLRWTHDSFLAGRKGDARGENPIIKSDDQAHIAYGKAPLALFALQEVLGEDAVNSALASYHARFKAMRPPLPTTLDLVQELRAVAAAEHQQLITDLFEKITLYDVGVTAANVVRSGEAYRVTLELEAHQYDADPEGNETEVPLDAWFQVALFAPTTAEKGGEAPIHQQQLRLRSGKQQYVIEVPTMPASAAIDPWYTMLDRLRDNNRFELAPPVP